MPVDLDPSNECVRVVPMAFVKGTEPAACGARRQSVPPAGTPGAPPPTGPGATPGAPGQTSITPPPSSAVGPLTTGIGALALPRQALPPAPLPSPRAVEPARPATQGP